MPAAGKAAARPGAGALLALLPAAPALAAAADGRLAAATWTGVLPWVLAALVAALYLRGSGPRPGAAPAAGWRRAAFLAGIAALALALGAPLAGLSRQLFWAGQLQALALHLAGPALICLAAPGWALAMGLPRGWRRAAVLPLRRHRAARLALGLALRPLPAATLYILALGLWLLPAAQAAALASPAVRAAMVLTLLASGLLLFRPVFDRRDPPAGPAYGARVAMLVAAMLAQIVLGSALLLKPIVLYPVYGLGDRLFGLAPLADEASGGFVIWAPSALILLATIFLSVHRWNGAEARAYARARAWRPSNAATAMLLPETAEELWIAVEGKNARLGLSLAAVPPVLMALVFATVETVRWFG